MMRELKALGAALGLPVEVVSCSPNPYDEGTERFLSYIDKRRPELAAAAQIPMMRELKGPHLLRVSHFPMGCSPNPYDEGTERTKLMPG